MLILGLVSLALAMTGADLLLDPALVDQARAEFRRTS